MAASESEIEKGALPDMFEPPPCGSNLLRRAMPDDDEYYAYAIAL